MDVGKSRSATARRVAGFGSTGERVSRSPIRDERKTMKRLGDLAGRLQGSCLLIYFSTGNAIYIVMALHILLQKWKRPADVA